MFEFLILAIILVLVVFILYKNIKRTKQGGCSCGGSCSNSCKGCDYLNNDKSNVK
ncbi:MAG: FeoB-associated Cys-rich membrane protein [Clostridium sp.]